MKFLYCYFQGTLIDKSLVSYVVSITLNDKKDRFIVVQKSYPLGTRLLPELICDKLEFGDE